MAKKELLFFKNRRELEIGDFQSLKSRGNERRCKVPIRIPLSNRPTAGIPEWILQGFEFVIKDQSFYDRSIGRKDISLEGMTAEFYTTDSVKRRMMLLSACTLNGFSVTRVGKDDKAIVYLNATVYAPCSEEIILWLYKHQDQTVYAEFDATQANLEYGGEGDEAEDGDDRQADLPIAGESAGDDAEPGAKATTKRSRQKN